MTRDAFIKLVLTTVTKGKRIPTQPNKEQLDAILTNSLRWFKQNDDESHQQEYIVIGQSNFSTPLFKEKRCVQLPKCVESIVKLQDSGALFSFSGISGGFAGSTGFNRAMMIGGNSDNMLYAVTATMYDDFIKSNFILRTTSFGFNPHSKLLNIEGHDPIYDLIASAYVHIDDESIFENDRFHRYVQGMIYQDFEDVFGLNEIKLLGGGRINSSKLGSKGEKMVEKVEKEIIEARSGDFLEYM